MSYTYIENEYTSTVCRRVVSEQQFLAACNGRCRRRLFTRLDYECFRVVLNKARRALRAGKQYHASRHAGTVGKSSNSRAKTAGWAVWIMGRQVCVQYGRFRCNNDHIQWEYNLREWHYSWRWPEDGSCYIQAKWCVSDGEPVDLPTMRIVTWSRIPQELVANLPEPVQRALRGTSWHWPEGTREEDCEAIVRERAAAIADMWPALAIISAYAA